MDIKHMIFDLDGTLWNTTEISSMAYNRALQEDGRSTLHITSDVIKQEFGKTLSTIAGDLFPEFDEKTRNELMDKCNCFNTAYLDKEDCDMLYPGVRETFDELSKYCSLYIVSNCQSGYIEMFLKKYSLEPYITDIECFGNNGRNKAENIIRLMERNGIQKAVYVGDTAGDYDSATMAGIPFIFASYGYGSIQQSAHSIRCFSELVDLVDCNHITQIDFDKERTTSGASLT